MKFDFNAIKKIEVAYQLNLITYNTPPPMHDLTTINGERVYRSMFHHHYLTPPYKHSLPLFELVEGDTVITHTTLTGLALDSFECLQTELHKAIVMQMFGLSDTQTYVYGGLIYNNKNIRKICEDPAMVVSFGTVFGLNCAYYMMENAQAYFKLSNKIKLNTVDKPMMLFTKTNNTKILKPVCVLPAVINRSLLSAMMMVNDMDLPCAAMEIKSEPELLPLFAATKKFTSQGEVKKEPKDEEQSHQTLGLPPP